MFEMITKEQLRGLVAPYEDLMLTPADQTMVLSEKLRRSEITHRIMVGAVEGVVTPHAYSWLAPTTVWIEVGGWCIDANLHFDQLRGHLTRIGIYPTATPDGRRYEAEHEILPNPIETGLFEMLLSIQCSKACMELTLRRSDFIKAPVQMEPQSQLEQGA